MYRIAVFVAGLTWALPLAAQTMPADDGTGGRRGAVQQRPPFRWNNPFPDGRGVGVTHATYFSEIHQAQIGYGIYLPPQYHDPAWASVRFPVVYWLSGAGSNEQGFVVQTRHFDPAIRAGDAPPIIYVLVNGGRKTHYDDAGDPDNTDPLRREPALAETTLIKELIPHIDRTYRTIASRDGRGIEGFSMGGRGTMRNVLKYPDVFSSAVAIAGGYQRDRDPQRNNVWELAEDYAAATDGPRIRVLLIVGDQDGNFAANKEYFAHLAKLQIPHQKRVLEGIGHDATRTYATLGADAVRFHAETFNFTAKPPSP